MMYNIIITIITITITIITITINISITIMATIITTNITDGALLEKLYTEKISSRLSSFVPFLFMGDDIRAQKAEEA